MRRHIPIGSNKHPYELKQLLIHNVMFYIFPPLNEISLFEFEVRIININNYNSIVSRNWNILRLFQELATDRLKILRIIESASAKYSPMTQEWKESVLREMLGEGLKSYVRLFKGNGSTPADMEARRKDYLSHFILRFAYCQNEEMRR